MEARSGSREPRQPLVASELRKSRSRALHAAHQAFLVSAEGGVDFRPDLRQGSADYNLHAADLDAEETPEWEFTAFGLDIERGVYDDRLEEIIATGRRPG